MAAKHERTGSDGITETREGRTFRLDKPLSAADRDALIAAMKRTIHNASFEAKTRALEPELRREVARSPMAAYGSRGYYAGELLEAIADVRRLRDLNSRGGIDTALAAAMRVGWLAAESYAKHQWKVVAIGIKNRQVQAVKGRKGGIKKGENAKLRHSEIDRYARHWDESAQSDESLQDEFRSQSAYVKFRTGIPQRTIQEYLKARKQRG